jgi:hypothetical protein
MCLSVCQAPVPTCASVAGVSLPPLSSQPIVSVYQVLVPTDASVVSFKSFEAGPPSGSRRRLQSSSTATVTLLVSTPQGTEQSLANSLSTGVSGATNSGTFIQDLQVGLLFWGLF